MKQKLILLIALYALLTGNLFAQNTWSSISDFPAIGGRDGAVAIGIGNKAYVGMGTDNSGIIYQDIWAYDPSNKTWTQEADFPGGPRDFATAFAIGNKGYFGTGNNNPWLWYKDIWQYDPATNRWVQKNDFGGQERYLAVSFTIGNKAYVGTGSYRMNSSVDAIYLNDFWQYDPVTDSWTQKANVPQQGRADAIGFSLGNKGYIGTGYYYYDTRMSDFWEYDTAADTWTQKADVGGSPRVGAVAFTVFNKGYVGGGYYYSAFNDLWAYNQRTNSWIQEANFPSNIVQGVGLNIGNKGYTGFAYNNDGTINNNFWEYTPEMDTILCHTDTIVSTNARTCDATVSGIDPVIKPSGFNPVVNFSLTFNGNIINTGTGSLSGTLFNKGTTIITYSLPDFPGQICSFRVIVNDSVAPVINCPSSQFFCYNSNNNYTIPTLNATDNCGIQSITYTITGATSRNGTGTNASGYFNQGVSTIKWIVSDSSGNKSTCQTLVTVNKQLSVTIPDILTIFKANTIYLGYGPSSFTLTANASGGTPLSKNTYKYLWSTGDTTKSIQKSPSPGVYTYTVTITDANGCQATAQKTITVINVSCGTGGTNVSVCVQTKSGYTQLCVPKIIVPIYLLLGGNLGSCNTTLNSTESPLVSRPEEVLTNNDRQITVFPNPNKGSFKIQLNNFNSAIAEIRITDVNGRTIKEMIVNALNKSQVVSVDLGKIARGMYFIQVVTDETINTGKVMVQ